MFIMKNMIVMKNIFYLIGLILAFQFSACTTINTLYMDQLAPAEVSFPEVVKSVGIINNMPLMVGSEEDMGKTDGTLEGEGDIVAEVLAEGIAATAYFDEVVICDSSVCNMKVSLKNHQSLRKDWSGNVLSNAEATRLIDELGVDMLFSIERVRIELKENKSNPEYRVIDGIVTPVLRAYIAEREQPIFTFAKSDTLEWEPNPWLTFKGIVREASEYAGSMLLPKILPYWKEAVRSYYDGGSVEMRDAGVYLREYNWKEAYGLWKKVYDEKKGKQKMRAAFNLALYHEMQGEFLQAEAYLEEAGGMADPASVDWTLIRAYLMQLDELERKYQQVRIQMGRFDDKN